jgi:polyisoprenoid-binding protein YceI
LGLARKSWGLDELEMGSWVFEPGHTAAACPVRHLMVSHTHDLFKNQLGSISFDLGNLSIIAAAEVKLEFSTFSVIV